MNEIISQIEAILFVASKPLTLAQLAKVLGRTNGEVEKGVQTLSERYKSGESGLQILTVNDTVRLATNPMHANLVGQFIKDEVAGELTKAQLETLTVVAYRGPITRPELDQIRGVNCAVIVRNLLVRGLLVEDESTSLPLPTYSLSVEALRHLGISSPRDLPDYDSLRNDHLLTINNQ